MKKKTRIAALLSAIVILVSGCSSCAFVRPKGDDHVRVDALTQTIVRIDHSISVNVDANFPIELRKEIGITGAGVVFKHDLDYRVTFVMTANHICDVDENVPTPFGDIRLRSKAMTVIFSDGYRAKAIPFDNDPDNDLCVLKVMGVGGTVAKIADEMPPLQSMAQIIGNPLGMMEPGIVPVSDGRFAGFSTQTPFTTAVFTGAIVGGFSGGGVFYDGKLVGIVSMRMREYEHSCLAVPLDPIHDLVKFSMKHWNDI